MRVKKRIYLFSFLLIAIIIKAIVSVHHYRMAPQLNPHPKHFLQVYGHVESGFLAQLILEYYTSNPNCKQTENWLEGVSGPRRKDLFYSIKTDKEGRYKIDIPLDGLSQGICGWHFMAVDFCVNKTVGIKQKTAAQCETGYTANTLFGVDKKIPAIKHPQGVVICLIKKNTQHVKNCYATNKNFTSDMNISTLNRLVRIDFQQKETAS